MSTPAGDAPGTVHKHRPYVPETMEMKELTFRAVFLGLILTVVLGAANAYLGLRAGITIAATYPAAVIAMAVLRAWKGSLLEENIARTAGSESERSSCTPLCPASYGSFTPGSNKVRNNSPTPTWKNALNAGYFRA